MVRNRLRSRPMQEERETHRLWSNSDKRFERCRGLIANARHLLEIIDGCEWPMFLAVLGNGLGLSRPDTLQGCELGLISSINVDESRLAGHRARPGLALLYSCPSFPWHRAGSGHALC